MENSISSRGISHLIYIRLRQKHSPTGELWRRWYGTSKFTERYTLQISDGDQPIALVDTLTFNNGNPVPAPAS